MSADAQIAKEQNQQSLDCRLCRYVAIVSPGGFRCVYKGERCLDGNKFKRTTIRPLWKRSKPVKVMSTDVDKS